VHGAFSRTRRLKRLAMSKDGTGGRSFIFQAVYINARSWNLLLTKRVSPILQVLWQTFFRRLRKRIT